jgi:hypothetical protein
MKVERVEEEGTNNLARIEAISAFIAVTVKPIIERANEESRVRCQFLYTVYSKSNCTRRL